MELQISEIIIPSISMLFIFYLFLGRGFLESILGCQFRRVLSRSRALKHFFGVITLFFFIVFTQKTAVNTPLWSLLMSGIIYFWFIISANIDAKYFFIFLGLISIIFINEAIIKEYYLRQNTGDFMKKYYEKIDYINKYVLLSALLITIYGSLVYLGKKRCEYKKNWSWIKYIFGKNKCKFNFEGKGCKKTELQYLLDGLKTINPLKIFFKN